MVFQQHCGFMQIWGLEENIPLFYLEIIGKIFYLARYFTLIQGRSHWEVGQGGQGGIQTHLPHFNFRTKKGPTVSVSNIKDIAFYGYSEFIRTSISQLPQCMLPFMHNLRQHFIFSNYIREIDNFTLDLLKMSNT